MACVSTKTLVNIYKKTYNLELVLFCILGKKKLDLFQLILKFAIIEYLQIPYTTSGGMLELQEIDLNLLNIFFFVLISIS